MCVQRKPSERNLLTHQLAESSYFYFNLLSFYRMAAAVLRLQTRRRRRVGERVRNMQYD